MKYQIKNYGSVFSLSLLLSIPVQADYYKTHHAILQDLGDSVRIISAFCNTAGCNNQEQVFRKTSNIVINTNHDDRLSWAEFIKVFNGKATYFYGDNGHIDRILIDKK